MIDAFLMMYQTDCVDCVAQSEQKNGVKMKKRRTEKTVRRSFIYMGKASENAVNKGKKHRKFGAFFGRGRRT